MIWVLIPLWDLTCQVVSQLARSCALSTLNSSQEQRKAAMQHSEGVNDPLSSPAADVGGTEVNRDEVFSIEPHLT